MQPGHALSVRAVVVLAAWLGVACNQAPSDLRTWQPSDHDHTSNPNVAQTQVTDAGTDPELPAGLDDLTIVTWQQNCTLCHGQLGRGDGPQGPLLHATNLSNPSWQASVTDQAIAQTIKSGRGKMPSFNFPDTTLDSLVRLIRLMDASRVNGAPASPGAPSSTAPAASTRPASSAAPAHSSAPAGQPALAGKHEGR